MKNSAGLACVWLGGLCLLAACAGSRQGVAPGQAGERTSALMIAEVPRGPTDVPPAPGESTRVGGDLTARVSGVDGDFRSGACRIDTPLPAGYPVPTPPGAVELKTYPGVRRAVVQGQGTPDRGMNQAFWPLFNHIKKHDIAMTSPVEMDFTGLSRGSGAPSGWSMAFLYRTPELNDLGDEGGVGVVDAPPVTVVAVGVKGDYGMSLVEKGMARIEEWLGENPGWEAAGDWRTLYYNGPALRWWNKWAEVQLPVRPAAR